jgi:hypothetical protein
MNTQSYQSFESEEAFYTLSGYDYLDACTIERDRRGRRSRGYLLSFYVSFVDSPPTIQSCGVWSHNRIDVHFHRIAELRLFHKRVVESGITLTDSSLNELPAVI